MSVSTLESKKLATAVGAISALFAVTIIQASPSQAGVVSKNNSVKAAATIISTAAGAAATGAVVGSVAGPGSSGALAAGAGVGVVAAGIAYTATTQAIEHPQAALQTVQVLNPATAPGYIVTHPLAVASGAKQIWNYLFR